MWTTIRSFNHRKRKYTGTETHDVYGLFFVFALHFSLERGKTHTLHIPVVDNDDDKTKCEFSLYVEAGALSLLLRNLTSANIVEMNDKEVRNTLLI